MVIVTFLLALGLIIIHIISKNLRFLDRVPRHWFLSISSGIAVAYVFIHLLPELQEYQEKLEESVEEGWLKMLEDHIYLISMMGLSFFYGLELLVRKYRPKRTSTDDGSAKSLFRIHMASFFIYNAIIGYLLIRGEFQGLVERVLFFAAMGVHFITFYRSNKLYIHAAVHVK